MQGVCDPGLSMQRNPGVRTELWEVVIKRERRAELSDFGGSSTWARGPGSRGRAAVKSITHPDNVELDTLESGRNPLGTWSVKPDKEAERSASASRTDFKHSAPGRLGSAWQPVWPCLPASSSPAPPQATAQSSHSTDSRASSWSVCNRQPCSISSVAGLSHSVVTWR